MNAIAIQSLPEGTTSYDLWDILSHKGLEPTIVVTAPEQDRLPATLHLEFTSDSDARRAVDVLRAHGTQVRVEDLAV